MKTYLVTVVYRTDAESEDAAVEKVNDFLGDVIKSDIVWVETTADEEAPE